MVISSTTLPILPCSSMERPCPGLFTGLNGTALALGFRPVVSFDVLKNNFAFANRDLVNGAANDSYFEILSTPVYSINVAEGYLSGTQDIHSELTSASELFGPYPCRRPRTLHLHRRCLAAAAFWSEHRPLLPQEAHGIESPTESGFQNTSGRSCDRPVHLRQGGARQTFRITVTSYRGGFCKSWIPELCLSPARLPDAAAGPLIPSGKIRTPSP